MSSKEVTKLRKEGKLEEAFSLALREWEEDPGEWTSKSLFWVLRDFVLYRFLPAGDIEHAQQCLDKMEEELLPAMMDDDVAEKAYYKLQKLILPGADEVKELSELSKENPDEAYRRLAQRFGTDANGLDRRLHEDFGWVLYRYLKGNSDNLTSVQTRRLLRDYMQLENDRPSLLHSMILNYALNFSKGHPDFSFYRFFMLWGAENLREDDYETGWADDHEIPSLTSRICKAIIDSGEDFDVVEFVTKFEQQDAIIEHLRQSYFWKLMNLQKEGRIDEMLSEFSRYAERFSDLGPSRWHSEILKIANRFMINENAYKFVPFFMKWDGEGNLRGEDWDKETTDDGKEFPSLAGKSAKKCFETIKASPSERGTAATLEWLKNLYEQVKQHEPDDDWSIRNYATICVWRREIEQAIAMYKSLFLRLGDKYYLWAELADLLPADTDLVIGLLLKAKQLEKNEDFLGEIHLKLAELWLTKGNSSIAQKELDAYAKHRKAKGWAITDRFRKLQQDITSTESETSPIDFKSYIGKAEDYVYDQYEWTDFVVTERWTFDGTECCALTDGKETYLKLKTKKFPILKRAKPGDVVQFRCAVIEETVREAPSALSWFGTAPLKVKKAVPLIGRTTDKPAWSILPVKYGVIDYVNEKKELLHIITQDSKLTFWGYKGNHPAADTFVRFREYEEKRKSGTRVGIADIKPCSSQEALLHMPSRVAAVDHINYEKRLFHVVLGQSSIGDIVRFDQTEIRPSVGDFLRVSYCLKTSKDGRKRIKFLTIKSLGEGGDDDLS